MEMLSFWATPSLAGYRPQRGIPQGNDVSSWLGTLYLVEMDAELLRLQRKRLIKYVRYVDDIKVFAKDRKTARAVIFTINRILRCLHLNMQSAKTDVYEGEDVRKRLHDERVERVTQIIDSLPGDAGHITFEQKKQAIMAVRPVFRKHLVYKREIHKEDLRLFKRILTLLTRVGSDLAVRQSLKWIWRQPALTQKVSRYLSRWMRRKSVRAEVEGALLGEEELFDAQYLYLLPMFRSSPVISLKHRFRLMRLGCGPAYHPAVRAEALLCLALFALDAADFKRLYCCYSRDPRPTVKKTILALFLKAPGHIKARMFAATIQEPDEETNRFRKYIWALANDAPVSQRTLAVLRNVEKDPARLLVSLSGALQSKNIETLKLVKQIADERLSEASSELAQGAFKQISTDAMLMIAELAKRC